MKSRILKNLGLGLALATGLTTAANATLLIQDYTWVAGTANPAPSSLLSIIAGNSLVNNSTTVSGNLIYNVTTSTIMSYSFDVTGTMIVTDSSVTPTTLVGTVLGDKDLNIANPPGHVVSNPSSGVWVDASMPVLFGPKDENWFVLGGKQLTGDWVPVPEPSTFIAGALLLLPFGANMVRIVRRNKS